MPLTHITPLSASWCGGGEDLVALLKDAFGKDSIRVRSPHHVQVQQQSKLHNIWIDSAYTVKYKLADQAGCAVVAASQKDLLKAIRGFESLETDLAKMHRALELSELIKSARSAMPLSGLRKAVFVDAGIKKGQAQIGVVRVSFEADGEHVRAESHPVAAANSTDAEQKAIAFALVWADPSDVIFCDNQSAVECARKSHGDRVRWLSRQHNKIADQMANMRSKRRKKRRKRRRKAAAKAHPTPQAAKSNDLHSAASIVGD